MKKLMIPAVALAMFMASCGGVKSDANKACDLFKEGIEIQKSGDKAKMDEFQKENETFFKEIEEKYKKDTVAQKEFEAIIKPCVEELTKSMGGN
jgi:hypothetical protein